MNAVFAAASSGGTIAASWTTLRAVGQDGYMQMAKNLMEVTDFLKKGIDRIRVSCSGGEGAGHFQCILWTKRQVTARDNCSVYVHQFQLVLRRRMYPHYVVVTPS